MRPPLAIAAAVQGGPFTWPQARGCYTEAEVRHRVECGRWSRLFRGVYVAAEPTPTVLTRAALLVAGPGLVACWHTAAMLHGFGVVADGDVHLAGVRGTDAAVAAGLRVHAAALDPADRTDVDGVPCTTAARTAVDLARRLDRLDGLAVIDAALRTGLPPEDLAAELCRHRGLAGIRRARDLVQLGDPAAESPMESRLRLRVLDAPLPRPRVQVWVGDRYRLDLGWEEQRVAAEYDGAGHLERLQQRSDAERRNWLTARGWTVLTFTDVDVYRRPDRIVATIRAALARSAGAAPFLRDQGAIVPS